MQKSDRYSVANKQFDPSGQQRQVLNVLKDEYQTNPRRIRDVTGLPKQRVNDALESLEAAGWVANPAWGLYQLVYNGDCYVEQTIHCRGEPPGRNR